MNHDWESFPTAHLSRDATLFRIHRQHAGPERSHAAWFDTSEYGRFNPPSGGPPSFGTNYSSLQEQGAFLETLAHDPSIRPSLAGHQFSRMRPTGDLRLADLTDPEAFGRFGIMLNDSTDRDLSGTQELASKLHDAGYDGVLYWSRHDPSAQMKSVALFSEPGLQPERFREITTGPVPPMVAIQTSVSHHVMLATAAPAAAPQIGQDGIAWASTQLTAAGIDHVVVGDAAASVHSRGLIAADSVDIVIGEGSAEMVRAVKALEADSDVPGPSRMAPAGIDSRLPAGAARVPTDQGVVHLMTTDGLRGLDTLRREGHACAGSQIPVAHIDDVAFARVSHPRLSAEPKTREMMAFRDLVQRAPPSFDLRRPS